MNLLRRAYKDKAGQYVIADDDPVFVIQASDLISAPFLKSNWDVHDENVRRVLNRHPVHNNLDQGRFIEQPRFVSQSDLLAGMTTTLHQLDLLHPIHTMERIFAEAYSKKGRRATAVDHYDIAKRMYTYVLDHIFSRYKHCLDHTTTHILQQKYREAHTIKDTQTLNSHNDL